jgi:hypothetical protein
MRPKPQPVLKPVIHSPPSRLPEDRVTNNTAEMIDKPHVRPLSFWDLPVEAPSESHAVPQVGHRKQPVLFKKSHAPYAFGDGLHHALQGKTIMLFDALGGGFQFDLGDLQGPVEEATSLDSRFPVLEGQYVQGNAQPWRTEVLWVRNWLDNHVVQSVQEAKLVRMLDEHGARYVFASFGMNPVRNHFLDADYEFSELFIDPQVFMPYWAAVSEKAFAAGWGASLGEGSLRISGFLGPLTISQDVTITTHFFPSVLPWQSYYASDANYGWIADWSMGKRDNLGASLMAGRLIEGETILGGQPAQVIDLDKGGRTSFAGFGFQRQLSKFWRLISSVFVGATDALESSGGLAYTDTLWTTTYDIGLEKKHVWAEQDSVTLRVGQPLRVESGTLTLDIPQSVNQDGSLNFSATQTSIVPSSVTTQVDVGYNLYWQQEQARGDAAWQLRLMTSYVKNPQHSDMASQWTHMISWRWWFKDKTIR